MIFNFTKVTSVFNGLRHLTSSWLITRQNDSRKFVTVNQNHQEKPTGSGIYGLLVSSEATHGHLF